MMKINVRRQSIIDYYKLALSHDATHWVDNWLRTHDVVVNFDNPDFLEIQDPIEFKELADRAKPPEHIKDEVRAFFDTCMEAYERLGTIYIDLWP